MSKQRRVTRFLLADVSKRAQIVKLQTEISFLDREVEALQCQLGIALYDAIEGTFTSMNHLSVEELLPDAIVTAYQECKTLIDAKRAEQSKRHEALDSHQSQRLRATKPSNLNERAKSIVDMMSSHSSDAKMKLENIWLEREMIREKQVFGRLIFDAALEYAMQNNNNNKSDTRMMEFEAVQLLIDETADKAADPLQRKAEKLQQVVTLEESIQQAWMKKSSAKPTIIDSVPMVSTSPEQ